MRQRRRDVETTVGETVEIETETAGRSERRNERERVKKKDQVGHWARPTVRCAYYRLVCSPCALFCHTRLVNKAM